MSNYKAKVEEPLAGVYKKWTLYTSNAPTSGPQLISLLNILEGFNLTAGKQLDLFYVHRLVESMRLTQTQLSNLGKISFILMRFITISVIIYCFIDFKAILRSMKMLKK